jgi:heme/copper-type cytochrome/quinol oxidase subunit 1
MPALTRWYIRTAFVYLALALLLAALLALPSSVPLPIHIRIMTPAYFHLFLVGWVTQMIFGVIYWMFPIISRARPRGNEAVGWASFILLNVGLILRVVGEPLVSLNPEGWYGWLLALSALLQWLAGLLFVLLAWPRIKEKYRGG